MRPFGVLDLVLGSHPLADRSTEANGAQIVIRYIDGDATRPEGDGPKIIAHVCNCVGGWGRGFVVAVSKRWRQPEAHYRSLASYDLGVTHFVSVEPNIRVANMIAQQGYGPGNRNKHRTTQEDSDIPLRYDALKACLSSLGREAARLGASVHMPRIGCALAGGSWAKVEPLIQSEVCALGVAVTVYDFGPYNP